MKGKKCGADMPPAKQRTMPKFNMGGMAMKKKPAMSYGGMAMKKRRSNVYRCVTGMCVYDRRKDL